MTNQIDDRTANLEMDFRPSLVVRAMSLTDECLAGVASATTIAELETLAGDYNAKGSVFSALANQSKDTVRDAWRARRDHVRLRDFWVAIWGTFCSNVGATPGIVPDLAPSLDAGTVEIALANAVAESVANAALLPTATPRVMRGQSAQAIALATATARAAGQRLAGYDGRIVDPGQGLGTVIQFGRAITEYDPVADRSRQVLVRWSDVENVRVAMNLPEKAFGRAPGLVGLLGKATQILNHGGFVARNVRTAGQFASAWKIGFFDNRVDSDSLGRKEALITLGYDGSITCDAPDHPGAVAVLADYNRRVAGTLIASDDLAIRIEACLVAHYGARSTDMGLYVSPWNAARALDLVVALRPIAGRKIRAWSHTDQESISDALCDSFATDLGRLERDIENKASDLKKIAGASLIERCERLKAELSGLTSILGNDATEGYKARITKADSQIVAALDATSQRAAMLEMD